MVANNEPVTNNEEPFLPATRKSSTPFASLRLTIPIAIITKKYITGTASCSGGITVTGTTTVWLFASWPASICQIKFGTQDSNGVGTPDTWHTINSWTDATHLELSAAGPNTGGAVETITLAEPGGNTYIVEVPANQTITLISTPDAPLFVSRTAGNILLAGDIGAVTQVTAAYVVK